MGCRSRSWRLSGRPRRRRRALRGRAGPRPRRRTSLGAGRWRARPAKPAVASLGRRRTRRGRSCDMRRAAMGSPWARRSCRTRRTLWERFCGSEERALTRCVTSGAGLVDQRGVKGGGGLDIPLLKTRDGVGCGRVSGCSRCACLFYSGFVDVRVGGFGVWCWVGRHKL